MAEGFIVRRGGSATSASGEIKSGTFTGSGTATVTVPALIGAKTFYICVSEVTTFTSGIFLVSRNAGTIHGYSLLNGTALYCGDGAFSFDAENGSLTYTSVGSRIFPSLEYTYVIYE